MEVLVSTTVLSSIVRDLYTNIKSVWTHDISNVTETFCKLDLVAKIELAEACIVTNINGSSSVSVCVMKNLQIYCNSFTKR